jgi:hypothetical protein
MNTAGLSVAQKRAQRRRAQGKPTGTFELALATDADVPDLEEYYRLASTPEEIEASAADYLERNALAYRAFQEKTRLDGKDIAFLFLAVALQCVRQYILTAFQDRVGEKATQKADKEVQNKLYDKAKPFEKNTGKQGGWYHRPLERILCEGVPYDRIAGSGDFDLGLGGPNHRCKTLGHDPVLGWVLGPMNIMTDTLTYYNFSSYHIRQAMIHSHANTGKIIGSSLKRLQEEPIAFAAAIVKQLIHFNSDVNTARSLPIPLVQSVSPEFAQNLAKYGLDMANVVAVGKQASYSMMINAVIAMIHRMFYDPVRDGGSEKLYEVRTRKILMYSNMIATGSNLIATYFTGNVKFLDVGGMAVTLYRIVTDSKVIRGIMHEFVDSEVSAYYDSELAKAREELRRICPDLVTTDGQVC